MSGDPQSAARTCFVIGPIGNRNAPAWSPERQRYEEALQVFQLVIRPACLAVGLSVFRADEIPTPGEITEQVCQHLRDDYAVIADVTDANPNVMYELGLRHTRDLLTVQIGEEHRLPFDISAIRTIRFVREEYALTEARDQLKRMLESGLSGGWDKVTATRVWTGPGTAGMAATEEPIEGAPETEEPGFLEILADSEMAMPRLTSDLQAITEVIEQLGQLATENTPRMLRAPDAGAKLAISNDYADGLEPLAETLDSLSGQYRDTLKQIDPGVNYLLGRIEADELSPEEAVSVREMLGSLVTTGRAAIENRPSTAALATSISSLGSASRRLRGLTERVSGTLRRIGETTETAVAWSERAEALLDRFPAPDTP